MAVNIPPPVKSDYVPAPAGTHAAVCIHVIDLGTQEVTFQNEIKHQRQVMLTWELPNEPMENGKPYTISQKYTFSLHERAKLRGILETWRGRPFTDADFGPQGFDVSKLLGRPCMVTIMHGMSQRGNTFARVEAVTSLPRGMAVPKQVNPSLQLSLERGEFDAVVFNGLSDFVRGLISKSPEFAQLKHDPSHSDAQAAGHDAMDDEIPFR